MEHIGTFESVDDLQRQINKKRNQEFMNPYLASITGSSELDWNSRRPTQDCGSGKDWSTGSNSICTNGGNASSSYSQDDYKLDGLYADSYYVDYIESLDDFHKFIA